MRDPLSKKRVSLLRRTAIVDLSPHNVYKLACLHTQRNKTNADEKWQKEIREDQEEKRKGKESELELICKDDLQRAWLSISLHFQGYEVKWDFFLIRKPISGLSVFLS